MSESEQKGLDLVEQFMSQYYLEMAAAYEDQIFADMAAQNMANLDEVNKHRFTRTGVALRVVQGGLI